MDAYCYYTVRPVPLSSRSECEREGEGRLNSLLKEISATTSKSVLWTCGCLYPIGEETFLFAQAFHCYSLKKWKLTTCLIMPSILHRTQNHLFRSGQNVNRYAVLLVCLGTVPLRIMWELFFLHRCGSIHIETKRPHFFDFILIIAIEHC